MPFEPRPKVEVLPRPVETSSEAGFVAKVYRWMFAGLLLTGVTAMFVAQDVALVQKVAQFRWQLVLLQLGLVFGLQFLLDRMSALLGAALFLLYSAVTGVVLSGIFWAYELGSISQSFMLAGGVFGAMSLYGAVTKKDLSAWSTFLFMGLMGIIGAVVFSFFMPSEGLSFVISCATVVVFAGLAAYDNQMIRALALSGGATEQQAIRGALALYLDFINLFLALLRLTGRRR